MGQGTVDLPDPLDAQQPDAGNAAGVDDLLAQLAGDEIDRLLAESEKPEASGATSVSDKSIPASPAAEVVTHLELPGPSDAEIEAVAAAESADLEMKATLDALAEDLQPATALDETQNVIAPDAVEKVLAEAAATDEANRATAEAATSSQPAPEVATSSAERAALAEPSVASSAAPAVKVDAEPQSDSDDAPSPMWLRPLELLSAPLDSASPGARDTIGKIAILTTFNAVAVLIYVMIFRRH